MGALATMQFHCQSLGISSFGIGPMRRVGHSPKFETGLLDPARDSIDFRVRSLEYEGSDIYY